MNTETNMDITMEWEYRQQRRRREVVEERSTTIEAIAQRLKNEINAQNLAANAIMLQNLRR